jgi:hypothetical protein
VRANFEIGQITPRPSGGKDTVEERLASAGLDIDASRDGVRQEVAVVGQVPPTIALLNEACYRIAHRVPERSGDGDARWQHLDGEITAKGLADIFPQSVDVYHIGISPWSISGSAIAKRRHAAIQNVSFDHAVPDRRWRLLDPGKRRGASMDDGPAGAKASAHQEWL